MGGSKIQHNDNYDDKEDDTDDDRTLNILHDDALRRKGGYEHA